MGAYQIVALMKKLAYFRIASFLAIPLLFPSFGGNVTQITLLFLDCFVVPPRNDVLHVPSLRACEAIQKKIGDIISLF